MKPSKEYHRQGVRRFFHSPSVEPVRLAANEIEIINVFLARLYADFGNIKWIKLMFTISLSAYWEIKNATREDALKHEADISLYMQRVVIARQFQRASSNVIKTQVLENTVDIVAYWNNYPDPYPPSNIEKIDEPYRSFFVLLKALVQEMDQRGALMRRLNSWRL